MIVSKERLYAEKKATGYRYEILEKVVWLIEILNTIAKDSYLNKRLALKGGTALNLFHFDLPRLSVDADLNYIGSIDRNIMLAERKEVERRVCALFERKGLNLDRGVQSHAGGKMVWRYNSVFGNKGNIEVDLNFMYRAPIFPPEKRSSVSVAGRQVRDLMVLDIHELSAGKLTALLDRKTGRDFFDAAHLFSYKSVDVEKLRFAFVLYMAMCFKKHLVDLSVQDIVVDQADLRNKLVPVMKHNFFDGFASVDLWIENLISKVQLGFGRILPFRSEEIAFIQSIQQGEGIKPALLSSDEELCAWIATHPALLWSNMNNKASGCN